MTNKEKKVKWIWGRGLGHFALMLLVNAASASSLVQAQDTNEAPTPFLGPPPFAGQSEAPATPPAKEEAQKAKESKESDSKEQKPAMPSVPTSTNMNNMKETEAVDSKDDKESKPVKQGKPNTEQDYNRGY